MSILRRIIEAILALFRGRPFETLDARLDRRAAESGQKLDWRNSIVDLMKTVGMDSSLSSRAKLAAELGHAGKFTGSKEQNIWLHGKVLERVRSEGI